MILEIIWDNLDLSLLYSLLLAVLVSFIAIPPIVRMAKLKHLVAQTNGRTSHNGNIPYLGGIAIFASVAISTCLFAEIGEPPGFQYIIPATLIIFFIGLRDDDVSRKACENDPDEDLLSTMKKLAEKHALSLIGLCKG